MFILICYSHIESKYLFEVAEKVSQKYQRSVDFYRVDASGKAKTASKVKNEKEMRIKNDNK